MASKNSNVRKFKVKPQLTAEEIQRISQKLAVALEHDTEDISLITMLFDHLERIAEQKDSYAEMWSALYDIKRYLFLGTSESDDAQQQFQDQAYANRGKLLLWPYEREAK